MKNKTNIYMLTLFTSLIMFNILYYTFETIFIKETPFGFEFRFTKLENILIYFYEGYHYEATVINLIITLFLSVYISYLIVKNVWELIFSHKL